MVGRERERERIWANDRCGQRERLYLMDLQQMTRTSIFQPIDFHQYQRAGWQAAKTMFAPAQMEALEHYLFMGKLSKTP